MNYTIKAIGRKDAFYVGDMGLRGAKVRILRKDVKHKGGFMGGRLEILEDKGTWKKGEILVVHMVQLRRDR